MAVTDRAAVTDDADDLKRTLRRIERHGHAMMKDVAHASEIFARYGIEFTLDVSHLNQEGTDRV
jgi:hypothetical protein